MIKSFFKIAIRNIFRKSSYSVINILGLSLGIAFSLLLLSWVLHDLSIDDFHENSDSIFLVGSEFAGEEYQHAGKLESVTPYPVGGILVRENPDILESSQFLQVTMPINIKIGDRVFHEYDCACTDSSFFNIFSFEKLKGNFKSGLSTPDGIIISESASRKYFGNDEALGKTLLLQNKIPVTVKGVFKDLPANSQFNFDIVLPYKIAEFFNPEAYTWHTSNNIWIKTVKNVDIELLSKRIRNTVSENRKDMVQPIHLISLKDYYYNNKYSTAYTRKGNMHYIWLTSLIALFILVIAGVNFVNLSTALAGRRFKEVGLKKTLGSTQLNIAIQFISEATLVTLMAAIISIGVYQMLLPVLEYILDEKIVYSIYSPHILGYLFVVIVVMSTLGGLYPAVILSRRPITSVFKDPSRQAAGKFTLEKFLVVFQFSISIFMIIGTLIIYLQMKHISEVNLGFDKERVMMIKSNLEISSKYEKFKSEMKNHPSIAYISCVNSLSSVSDWWTNQINWEGKELTNNFSVLYNYVDPDFMKLMGIKIKSGRDFDANIKSDLKRAFIINKVTEENMNLTDASGLSCKIMNFSGHIAGVVDNPKFQSLHTTTKPRVFIPVASPDDFSKTRLGGIILIKTKAKMTRSAMEAIKSWGRNNNISITPDFLFLNDAYANMYKKEEKISNIFSIFSGLSLFISCVGIFILNAFYTQKKSKEIAIRKINGASVSWIYQNNLTYIVKWIIISFILSSPLTFYIMNNWLENFAHRTKFSWWLFVVAGFSVLFMALITVSWQSYKSATQNPVKALRYE